MASCPCPTTRATLRPGIAIARGLPAPLAAMSGVRRSWQPRSRPPDDWPWSPASQHFPSLGAREQRRIPGKGSNTNRYHLDGLIKAAQPYAEEKLQQRAERDEEKKKTVARKGKPKLRVVKNDE